MSVCLSVFPSVLSDFYKSSDDDNGRDRVFSDASYDEINNGGAKNAPSLPQVPSNKLPTLPNQRKNGKETAGKGKVTLSTPKKQVKTPPAKKTATPAEDEGRGSNPRRGSLWDNDNPTLARMLSRNDDDDDDDDDNSDGSDWD